MNIQAEHLILLMLRWSNYRVWCLATYIKTFYRQGSTEYLHVGLIYQDPNNDGTLQALV